MLEQWAATISAETQGFLAGLQRPENRGAAMILLGSAGVLIVGLSAAIAATRAVVRRNRAAFIPLSALQRRDGQGASPSRAVHEPPARDSLEAYAEILWLCPDDPHAARALRARGAEGQAALARCARRPPGSVASNS